MEIAKINNIDTYINKEVKINGWVYNTRRSGKIGFLMVRDGYGLLQCIVEKSHIGEDTFESFKKLTNLIIS